MAATKTSFLYEAFPISPASFTGSTPLLKGWVRSRPRRSVTSQNAARATALLRESRSWLGIKWWSPTASTASSRDRNWESTPTALSQDFNRLAAINGVLVYSVNVGKFL